METFETIPTQVKAVQWFPGRRISNVVEEDIAIGNFYYHAYWQNCVFSPGNGRVIEGTKLGLTEGDWIVIDGKDVSIYHDRVFQARFRKPQEEISTTAPTEVIRRKSQPQAQDS